MSDEINDPMKDALANMQGFADMVSEAAQAAEAEEESLESSPFAAVVEAAYIIAAADGDVSEDELSRLVQGLVNVTDSQLDEVQINALMQTAAMNYESEGRDARLGAVAELLPDSDSREAAFLVAAGVSWAEGGVSTQEGLALQALSRAFDIPMNQMHQLLGQAHGG